MMTISSIVEMKSTHYTLKHSDKTEICLSREYSLLKFTFSDVGRHPFCTQIQRNIIGCTYHNISMNQSMLKMSPSGLVSVNQFTMINNNQDSHLKIFPQFQVCPDLMESEVLTITPLYSDYLCLDVRGIVQWIASAW